jgi:molybdate transport system permease protein
VLFAPLLLSLEVASVAVLIAAVAGTALAVVLARRSTPSSDLLEGIVTAPMVLPPTVLGYYVLVLCGRQSALGRLFEGVTGAPLVFSPSGAVLAATIGAMPLVVLSSRAALASVDPTLVRAARTLGATALRAFVTIELPLALPGIAAGLLLGFARALGEFGVTLMVAGDIPGRTQTASLAIYDAVSSNREGDAAVMIAFLTVTGVASVYAARRLSRRYQ